MSTALVEISRTYNVKFEVADVLAEFPQEWAEWRDDDGDAEEFVREMVAEVGLDLLDYDWAIPEPMHDEIETSVRFRSAE